MLGVSSRFGVLCLPPSRPVQVEPSAVRGWELELKPRAGPDSQLAESPADDAMPPVPMPMPDVAARAM